MGNCELSANSAKDGSTCGGRSAEYKRGGGFRVARDGDPGHLALERKSERQSQIERDRRNRRYAEEDQKAYERRRQFFDYKKLQKQIRKGELDFQGADIETGISEAQMSGEISNSQAGELFRDAARRRAANKKPSRNPYWLK